MKLTIYNKYSELLEAISEGAEIETADKILIMVHGLGTNLHERGLFDDIVQYLIPQNSDLAIVRFSWSSFGESEGRQEETTLDKVAEEIKTIFDYVLKNKKSSSKISVLAHSMGNQALCYLLTNHDYPIRLYIAECPPDLRDGNDVFAKWLKRPNTTVDEKGVLVTPRADGSISKFGQGYWDSIDPDRYKKGLETALGKYKSVLIRGLEDDVINNDSLKEFPFSQVVELHGNHSFSKPEDRKIFLDRISEILRA